MGVDLREYLFVVVAESQYARDKGIRKFGQTFWRASRNGNAEQCGFPHRIFANIQDPLAVGACCRYEICACLAGYRLPISTVDGPNEYSPSRLTDHQATIERGTNEGTIVRSGNDCFFLLCRPVPSDDGAGRKGPVSKPRG